MKPEVELEPRQSVSEELGQDIVNAVQGWEEAVRDIVKEAKLLSANENIGFSNKQGRLFEYVRHLYDLSRSIEDLQIGLQAEIAEAKRQINNLATRNFAPQELYPDEQRSVD